MSLHSDSEDNLIYQRRLADCLRASLGYEAAMRACQNMSWYGVQLCLLNDKAAGRRVEAARSEGRSPAD